MILNKWEGQSERSRLLLSHSQGARHQPRAWRGPCSAPSGLGSVLSKFFHMHLGRSQDG